VSEVRASTIAVMAGRGDRIRNGRRGREPALPEPDLFHRPEAILCEKTEVPVDLTKPGHRIVQSLWYFDFRLVYFAILWIELTPNGWRERYSVDTGHGYFHEHTHGHAKADRKDIKPLYTYVDVQECFDEGYDLVHGKYVKQSGG